MDHTELAFAIQTQYPQIGTIERLTRWSKNLGFSGHPVYQVQTTHALFAAKPLSRPINDPLGPFHQRVLLACENPQTSLLAVPLLQKSGTAWFHCGHYDWEITRWLPGKADFNAAPTLVRLQSLMRELAGFHMQAAKFWNSTGPSRTVQYRAAELAKWSNELQTLEQPLRVAVTSDRYASVLPLYQLLATGIERLLPTATYWSQKIWPLQPIIRDVWHDHVLFTDQALTGIIDLETIAIDIVSCDLSRLLGSLDWPDSLLWPLGLENYQTHRPLIPELLEVIPWLHGAGTVLGAIHWLQWLFVERRQFESPARVDQRLNWLLKSLQNWLNTPSS